MEPSSITLRHQPAERYHLVGICGAGLKALAEYLCDQGHCVSGSDTECDTRKANCLGQLGVTVLSGHRKEHLCPEVTCVVHSAAVPADNPELEAARARGIPVVSYPQFLAELTRSRETIGVAGTHGKSTTTAILATLLRGLGGKPDVLCGAESIDSGRNGSAGDGSRLVLECCEFRRHFLGLTIPSLLVTGIEWDHVDCFGSLSDTVAAFAALLRRVPESGIVVFNGDCAATRRAITTARIAHRCTGPRVISFGDGDSSDWQIRYRRPIPWGTQFDLQGPEGRVGPFQVGIPGRHNARNAAGAVVLALESGVPVESVQGALRQFSGVRRRLQLIGEWRGMTVIDDYAHHPTAIREVLTALRTEFPGKPLRLVYQPHQAQRTRVLSRDFVQALSLADAVHLLPVYAARESDGTDALSTTQSLVAQLAATGRTATIVPSLDHLTATLETEGRPGDVVVLMGAGSIERIADEFTVRLRRHHAG